MTSKLKQMMFNNKFNLAIGIATVLTFAINVFAYLAHSSNLNRCVFFAEGIVAQLILYRLLKFAIDRCKIKIKRSDIIVALAALMVSFIIYVVLVRVKNIIYTWDSTTYYNLMNSLLNYYDKSVLQGLTEWWYSGMHFDYGCFMLIFIYPFYAVIGGGIEQFIFSYYFGCVIPAILTLYIISLYISQKTEHQNSILFKISIGIVIVFFPLLHSASILGQPDIFGLCFAGIIVLLTLNYDFKKADFKLWIVLFLITIFLMLTRRWYMFFILAYYVSYFTVLMISIIIKRDSKLFKKTIFNVLIFGVSSLTVGFALLKDLISLIFTRNYAYSYAAWDKGGFPYEVFNQVEFLGLLVTAVVILGWIYGLSNRIFRKITITMLCTYVVSIFAFTRIQNMGHHQSLILIIPYFYGIVLAILLLYKFKFKYMAIIPASIILLSFVNCSFFNTSNNIGDLFMSKISLYPVQRTDLKGIDNVVKYLQNTVKGKETVAVLAASDLYDSAIFRDYPSPKQNDFIIENNYYASSEGFPDSFFTSKYLLVISPQQAREQAKKEGVLNTIEKEFKNNPKISKKFIKLQTVPISEEITAEVYERITPVDNYEVDIFIKDFEDYCNKYRELFYDRLIEYKK